MTPEQLRKIADTAPVNLCIQVCRSHFDALIAVAEAAGDLVGPNNIGKTVDTTIKWEGDISSIFTGESLHRLMMALKKLEAVE